MRSRWHSTSVLVAGVLLVGCPEREPLDHTQPELSACSFDAPADPDRVVLATVIDGRVTFVRGDGSSEAVFQVGGGRELAWVSPTVTERDGYVLVAATFDDPIQGTAFETALLDLAGRVLWQRVNAPGVYEARLGEAGRVALVSYADESAIVFPDGTVASIGRFIPIGAPRADGSVPARALTWGPSSFGWIRPGDEALSPLAYLPEAGSDPIVAEGELVYLTADEAGTRLVVVEGPSDVRTIEVPAIADAYFCTLGVPNEDGWVLVREGSPGLPIAAIHLPSGSARPISATIPDGMRLFNHTYWYQPGIDRDGAILLGLRDDYEGALYRSVDGKAWERIGATVSEVMAVEADSRAGTYAILGTSARYSWEEWPAPPAEHAADLVGDALQIVRPEEGLVHTLPAPFDLWISATVQAPMMSGDGACVAYWDAPTERMPSLHVLEVASGKRFDVGGPAVGMSPAAVAWITSATR